ncbi:Probable transmembrane protein [hydrothermal vent metagenome]|uniref:Probable transmembrane protein n=1 Tax=hydrothermal vent metagenome TaxID=652676 RepID=A0A160TQ43_9ZZZZ
MEEWSVVHKVALWGFWGAFLFGIIAHKTHFCTMGAISDWINMGSLHRLRAWLLAMAVALLMSQLFQAIGWIDLSASIYLSTNFGIGGYIVGGFLFGVGMTLGGGCGQRTLVRTGGGNLKSLVVLLVLGLTAYITLRGLLAGVRIEVFEPLSIDLSEYALADQSLASVLVAVTGLASESVVKGLAVIIGLALLIYTLKDKDFRTSGDAIVSGLVVVLLVAGAWLVTGVVGNDDFDPVRLETLTFIAPVGNMLNYLMTWTGSTIGFGIAVVFGVLAGSLAYAVASGNFRIETFSSRSDMLNHLYAGVLLGFGGVLSLGCTIGQGVGGFSTLALGSVVSIVFIVFGCALTIKMQYYMLDDGFARSLRQSLADLRLLPRQDT